MDIARPDIKAKKNRRRIVTIAVAIVVLAGVTFAVMRLKPAAPTVERSVVWTDTVKRGNLIRQVRGNGTLVPREDAIRQIPAQTAATVTRILVLPGSNVKADTVLMELNDPTVTQQALDAKLALSEAEADLKNTQVQLQSTLSTQKATAATTNADYETAKRQASTDDALYKLGVVSGIAAQASQSKADGLTTQNQMQQNVVSINEKALETQLAVAQAKVDQARGVYQLKQQQLDALRVKAGIAGVLTDLPMAVGQQVTPGTMLAKVVVKNQLKAALNIPETQARDIQTGQPAAVDTHNGIIDGTVQRIDPGVHNGTVTVDVALNGFVEGERPDLSVDGQIDLQRLSNVLYVGRPAFGNEDSTISLFKLSPDGKTATRVPVKVGRASVNAIQVLSGLNEGDTVILSDMSRWDQVDRIRLE
ncbi:MAG TPA: efflux RND transporter periplasmic adaptor subunit [Acidobacteriaceae bacterium]|jgi:multidrug efflux pump subunit AcrA (membrane-fusion protein)|nr:efflux RND transporter periplasmic adaptor subunit [Acidobacteriaceae bacterium]